jgi:hypothetical protein
MAGGRALPFGSLPAPGTEHAAPKHLAQSDRRYGLRLAGGTTLFNRK